MKVSGPGASAPASGPGASKRIGEPGFNPGTAVGGSDLAVQPVAGAGAIASLGALLALQETRPPLERRRRATVRAGRLLDVLDEMKLALLGGDDTGSALERLKGAVTQARDTTDDPKLEGILDEIETRAAVELAKRESGRAAA